MQEDKLKKIVERELEEHFENRNSDKWLVINTIRTLGFKFSINVDEVADMPSFESITRASRQLKKDNPRLKGSDENERMRREKEQEYKEHYSRKIKEDYPFASKYIND